MRQKITDIPLGEIRPNPMQPRRYFDPDGLRELADSIREFGILQPLNVRRQGKEYELIAGERRLRAARLAGLTRVPCIVSDADMRDSALIALVENLQRRDLDYIDEAEGIARLLRTYGYTQDEAARKLGKSQSSIANKLRILKLSPEILYILRESGLTERHARALLRLPANEERLSCVAHIVRECLNVAETERLVEECLSAAATAPEVADNVATPEPTQATPPVPPEPRDLARLRKLAANATNAPKLVIKDLRLFYNTISRGLDMLKRSGIDAVLAQDESDAAMTVTITIPK